MILLSTVLSVMTLYLLKILPGYAVSLNLPFEFGEVLYAESSYWGDIPSDLSKADLIELALVLTLTAFVICLAAAVVGQLFHAVRGLYLPCPSAVKICGFGPFFVLFCGLGIWYFIPIEPFQGAVALAVVPAFCMYGTIFKQIGDFVPEMGEIAARLDPKVEGPLDMRGLALWLKRKMQL